MPYYFLLFRLYYAFATDRTYFLRQMRDDLDLIIGNAVVCPNHLLQQLHMPPAVLLVRSVGGPTSVSLLLLSSYDFLGSVLTLFPFWKYSKALPRLSL